MAGRLQNIVTPPNTAYFKWWVESSISDYNKKVVVPTPAKRTVTFMFVLMKNVFCWTPLQSPSHTSHKMSKSVVIHANRHSIPDYKKMNKKCFWRGCPLSAAWFIIYKGEWVGEPSAIICITLVDCSRQRNKTRPCARSPAEICPPERPCRRGWRLSINTDGTRVKVKIQVSAKWQLEETMQELHIHCKKGKEEGDRCVRN